MLWVLYTVGGLVVVGGLVALIGGVFGLNYSSPGGVKAKLDRGRSHGLGNPKRRAEDRIEVTLETWAQDHRYGVATQTSLDRDGRVRISVHVNPPDAPSDVYGQWGRVHEFIWEPEPVEEGD